MLLTNAESVDRVAF